MKLNEYRLNNELTNLGLFPFYKEYDIESKEYFFKISKQDLLKKTKYYLEESIKYLNYLADEYAGIYENFKEITQDDFFEIDLNKYYNKKIEIENQTFMPILKIIIKYKKMIDGLLKLNIPGDELNNYINNKEEGKNIKKYKQLKTELQYAIYEYIVSQDSKYINYNVQKIDIKNSEDNVVLNHNNPFADVSINNQQYLYPTSDKKFKTLSFNIGYIMDKQSTDNNEAIVLTPNFKIKNTYDRDNFNIDISMSDSITSPIKKVENDKEVLYI